MNVDISLGILGLPSNIEYTIRDIQKQFKKMALIYHPDKSSSENTEKFQSLIDARDFMISYISIHNDRNTKNIHDDSLNEIDTLISMYLFFYKGMTSCKINNTKKITEYYLFETGIRTLIKIIENKINTYNSPHTKVMLLRPSLQDLLYDNIFIYKSKLHTYYIPLWHKEVVFFEDETDIEYIFFCIPNFSKTTCNIGYIQGICMDDVNNLYIMIVNDKKNVNIQELEVDGKTLDNYCLLKNEEKTSYCNYHMKGVLKPSDKNIYDVSERSNISVKIIHTHK